MKNYYKVLQISQDASVEVIHAAYKAMSKKYHPDLYEGDKAEASVKMQEINEAYDVLSDVNRRKAFDDELNSFIRQKKVRVVGASVNENPSNSTGAGMNNNTSTNSAQNANTSYYNNYGKQNTVSTSTPTPPPPSQNIQNSQGSKKKFGGCGCFIVIIIIVIGIVIFMNRKTFFGGDNNVTETSNSVFSTSALPDDPDSRSIKNTISAFIDATISKSSGVNLQEGDIQRECTTQKFDNNKVKNFETRDDWVNDLTTILNTEYPVAKKKAFTEFCLSTLIDLLSDARSNTNYEITNINIDGDSASVTVKIQAIDFPAMITATANKVQKDAERSDNLGITPDYSELFKKYIEKVKPDYINSISENFEFILVKEEDDWKIDEINDRKEFLNTLVLNMADYK